MQPLTKVCDRNQQLKACDRINACDRSRVAIAAENSRKTESPENLHTRGERVSGVGGATPGGGEATPPRLTQGVARLRLAPPCSRGRDGVRDRGVRPQVSGSQALQVPTGHLESLSADSWGGGSSLPTETPPYSEWRAEPT